MLHTYSEVMARALIVEREMEEAQRLRSRNSRFGGSEKGERGSKCQNMSHPQQSSMKQGEYSGSADGVKGKKRCYECGEMRHLRSECPRLQQCCYQPSQMQFQQMNSSHIHGRQPQRKGDYKQGKPATKSEQGQ